LISEHTLERLQTCPTKQAVEGVAVSASDSDSETDGEDNDNDRDHARGAAVARIPFRVNPYMDLKSVGLLDMVATKPVASESQITVPSPTGLPENGRQLTVDEVFASLE
jgi:hypothetical protein